MKSENLNNSSAAEQEDGRSEMMSTSTVSRVEEQSRMKDVEDSFEDRYSKLKLIAIKLKKKCGEQAKIIQELQNSRKAKAEEDLSGGNVNKDKVASLTKNFELLQGQYDTVVDKLESTEAEVKQLTRDLEASLAECLSSKQRAEECLQATSNAKTELARVEEKARDAESRLRSVEVTAEEERRERVALEERAKEQEGTAAQLREGWRKLLVGGDSCKLEAPGGSGGREPWKRARTSRPCQPSPGLHSLQSRHSRVRPDESSL